MMNKLLKLQAIILCLLFSITVYGQINVYDQGGGNHYFDSQYPQEFLHFYLYGDGYHSFENSNIPTDFT